MSSQPDQGALGGVSGSHGGPHAATTTATTTATATATASAPPAGPATSQQTPIIIPPEDDASAPADAQQSQPRRGSFSFLRRSKSKEAAGLKQSGGSQKGGAKLTRRAKSLSKEESARQKAQQLAPQLPSYQNLPQISAPFTNGTAQNNSSYAYPPSTASSDVPVSRSGYNPNAFYQRRQMDRNATTPSAASQSIPVPPIPGSSHGSTNDPHTRTESMTNRGRYSYASSLTSIGNVNSPRRVRRRKDPTPFNVLVVGTKSSGKTSFVDFLRTALTRPSIARQSSPSPPPVVTNQDPNAFFTSQYFETNVDGERIGFTLYDSNGLERHIIDLQLREMSFFLESKFQETFDEEQKVLRATGVKDPHIHVVFLLLDPARLDQNIASASPNGRKDDVLNKPRLVGGLDQDLDVDLIRTLQGKTTVIPIISKADTITTAHMSHLKRVVWDSLRKLKVDPLEALELNSDDGSDYDTASSAGGDDVANGESAIQDDDSSTYRDAPESGQLDEVAERTKGVNVGKATDGEGDSLLTPKATGAPQHAEIRMSTLSENVDLPYLPLSVLSPDMYDPGTVGRRFPWGFADPYNIDHCDFTRLKDSVFSEWRAELRVAARERWYEGWRTSRLRSRGNLGNAQVPNGRGYQGANRAVSTAAAYRGRAAEPPKAASTSTGQGRAVSASDIGVAVSQSSRADQRPVAAARGSYRGVGTY